MMLHTNAAMTCEKRILLVSTYHDATLEYAKRVRDLRESPSDSLEEVDSLLKRAHNAYIAKETAWGALVNHVCQRCDGSPITERFVPSVL